MLDVDIENDKEVEVPLLLLVDGSVEVGWDSTDGSSPESGFERECACSCSCSCSAKECPTNCERPSLGSPSEVSGTARSAMSRKTAFARGSGPEEPIMEGGVGCVRPVGRYFRFRGRTRQAGGVEGVPPCAFGERWRWRVEASLKASCRGALRQVSVQERALARGAPSRMVMLGLGGRAAVMVVLAGGL